MEEKGEDEADEREEIVPVHDEVSTHTRQRRRKGRGALGLWV